jgi:hypothetical protein
VPHEDGAPASVLELAPWQQEELDELAANVLTDRQWQAVDDAVVTNVAAVLVDQAEEHLR